MLSFRGQSGPGSDGNEGVLRIPQSSSIAGTSPSDCLVSYPGHSLGSSYPSAEVQSVYSTAPADWAIGIMVRVFANGQRDLDLIPGRVIPKTQKMILDTALLNTQHYKVWIKGKVEQFWERSSTLPYTLVS